MYEALVISDVDIDDATGRASDLQVRETMFAEMGWNLTIESVSDPYVLTVAPETIRLFLIARRKDVDVVISLSNPFHLQLIGFVVSVLAGCLWVAEFRDPMVTNPDREPGSLVTRLAALVERFTVSHADHVVWGDGMQLEDDYFEETYSPAHSSSITKLPFKGYDTELFNNNGSCSYDTFTVTYAGSFYEGWIEPFAFLHGVAEYHTRENEDIRVQFYGDWREEYSQSVSKLGLESVVDTYNFVPKERLVPVLRGSDVLLYIGGSDERNRLSVPSKLMDYIGAGKPILAVVDPSFRSARVVENNGFGVAVDPTDTESIADALHEIRTGEFTYDPNQAVSFQRRNKNEQYVEVLDSLVDDSYR